MKVSLNKAQKIYKKLKDLQNQYRRKADSPIIRTYINTINSDSKESVRQFLDNVENQKESLNEDFYRKLEINESVFELKTRIFETNASQGLSELLNNLECEKMNLGIYEDWMDSLESDVSDLSMSPKEAQKLIKMLQEKPSGVNYLTFNSLDSKDLKEFINSYRHRISKLEDQISLVNAKTELEIELSSEILEMIGLSSEEEESA